MNTTKYHVDTLCDVFDSICKINRDCAVLARVEQGIVKPMEEVVFLPTHTLSNPCTGKDQRVDESCRGDNVGLNLKTCGRISHISKVIANPDPEVYSDMALQNHFFPFRFCFRRWFRHCTQSRWVNQSEGFEMRQAAPFENWCKSLTRIIRYY